MSTTKSRPALQDRPQDTGQRSRQGTKSLPQIEVVLSERPRYRPSPRDDSRPVRLVPLHDSTAFIVKKHVVDVVLPPKDSLPRRLGASKPAVVSIESASKKHDKGNAIPSAEPPLVRLQKRLHYIVGFTDLQVARLSVPATEILDYVSPWAVEDFESKEFRRTQAAKRRAVEEAQAAKTNGQLVRCRGRPLGAKRGGGVETVSGTPTPTALEADTVAQKRTSRPSLAPSQKDRIRRLLEVEDSAADTGTGNDETSDDEAAMLRQLTGEQEAGLVGFDDDRSAPPPVSSGPKMLATPSVHPPPVRSVAKSAQASRKRTVSAAESIPYQQSATPMAKKTRTEGSSVMPNGATPVARVHPAFAQAVTPVHPLYAMLHGGYQSAPHTSGFTPVARAASSVGHGLAKGMQRSQSVSSDPSISIGKPLSHFKSKLKFSSTKADPSPDPLALTAPIGTAADEAEGEGDEGEEQEWTVRKLLADKWDYDIGGNLVHFYQVLWEGKWPPGQNPTWEPQANIMPELVRDYDKRKVDLEKEKGKEKQHSSGPSSSSGNKHMPKKRYSNVAEAFEGDLAEGGGAHAVDGQGARNDDDDDDDGLFVTEEHRRAATATQKAGGDAGIASTVPVPAGFSAFDKMLGTYRQVWP